MENKKKISKKELGFSLMEVIIAIYIITTALMGIMALVISINSSARVSAAKLIAANLAQEGIEVVKSIRDLNFGVNGWDDWYASISGSANYIAQYNDTALRPFSDVSLKYDSVTGL